MRVTVLGSGSSGNATLVSTANTAVLVDLGFGPRSLQRRLKDSGFGALSIDAVVVSHGHCDHWSGVPSLCSKHDIAIYGTSGTQRDAPALAEEDRWIEISAGQEFEIGDIAFEPFSIAHDASQPVGFRVRGEGVVGAVATDLGEIGSQVAEKLSDTDWLVLESNHDEEMLRIGPYPWHLKRRVLGPTGHLSNRALGNFLRYQFDGRADHLFLAHLSSQNNAPGLALKSAERAISARRTGLFDHCHVHLTHQSKPSIVLDL